ncbi:hypothetical protein ACN09C_27745 (plasmid) [Serratia fonticola]|jgi:hypothetical protein|uniref:hypothetical protein n=1 Tax=Serratia fonticola TaxID=47917 RepID=UPI003B00C960
MDKKILSYQEITEVTEKFIRNERDSLKALDIDIVNIFDTRPDRCAAAVMGAYELWNQLTADFQTPVDKARLLDLAFSI